jgi:hypothetical protein
MFDVAAFDNWLKSALKDGRMPVHPKRHAGAKPNLRREVARFAAQKYGYPIPSGVPYKQIADALSKSSLNVRFWHEADMTTAFRDVCFRE